MTHRPSNETRNMARILSESGLDRRSIALALKISVPTLRQYYGSEIGARRNAIPPGGFHHDDLMNDLAQEMAAIDAAENGEDDG